MSCCGRIPAAETRRASQRRRAWRWACSVLTPETSPSAGAADDAYRALLQIWLRLGDGYDGRHLPCTAKRRTRQSDKRAVPTH